MWTVRIYEERRRDREIREGKKDGIWYPTLGRQQSSSSKKAKRNFSQNQNLPRYLKRHCLPGHIFRRDSYTGLRTCVAPLKGQYHKIFKIIFPWIILFYLCPWFFELASSSNNRDIADFGSLPILRHIISWPSHFEKTPIWKLKTNPLKLYKSLKNRKIKINKKCF